jgi:hypothetical protein
VVAGILLSSNIVHNWDIRGTHSVVLLAAIALFGRGMAMSEFKHQYLGTESGAGDASRVSYPIDHPERTSAHGLRYSSPWPWIVAIVISLAMWTSIAALVWVLMR